MGEHFIYNNLIGQPKHKLPIYLLGFLLGIGSSDSLVDLFTLVSGLSVNSGGGGGNGGSTTGVCSGASLDIGGSSGGGGGCVGVIFGLSKI